MYITINPQPQQGWECPKCGGVYAPWMAQCTTCPGVTFITAGTTTPEANAHVCTYPEGVTCPTCMICGQMKPADVPTTITYSANEGNVSCGWTTVENAEAFIDKQPLLITRLLGV